MKICEGNLSPFSDYSSEVKKIVYLEPSHCPFICSMAVVASFFLTKETNPYPFDFPVTISLTTRQSLISPKGANAVLKVSVSISGDKSPTKMWWCWDVSTLPCCVPVELVAQLTWNKNWKKLENHRKVIVKTFVFWDNFDALKVIQRINYSRVSSLGPTSKR